MFPAARKGDPLTHDMLVPCGAVSIPASGPCPPGMTGPVMIEMLPAAHVACIAVCTGVITGGIVHPPVPVFPFGTPIVKGSVTVMIHGMPAARWFTSADVAACGTFIGMPALLAARRVFIGG
jgi:uncharacterized Zn-binding protein involved in type VI secretion